MNILQNKKNIVQFHFEHECKTLNKLTKRIEQCMKKKNIYEYVIFKIGFKTFLAVQLRLSASIARGKGSTPNQGTKIPQATQ